MNAANGNLGTIRTMCGMFCHPTMCGIRVRTDGNRIVGVAGDPENPDSKGFLCVRGQAVPEVVHSSSRFLKPLKRQSGSLDSGWSPVSWESALDLIADRMAIAGREQVGVLYGHGALQSGVGSHLISRFANMYGCQRWIGSINCWVYGALGFAITGVIKTNSKEDLGANSKVVLLWGANPASQPNTARYIAQAKSRGAVVATIDCRAGENAHQSDIVILIRPGTDAALALGMMHVIVTESLHDQGFIDRHTVGFPQLRDHLQGMTPEWACEVTGVPSDRIRELARLYASCRPAMIVAGGSSMYKHAMGWLSSRAISCLPALTGNLGVAGGGLGPRHAAPSELDETVVANNLADDGRRERVQDISARQSRLPGRYLSHQQGSLLESVLDGRLRVLLIFGSNLLVHFPDSNRLEQGLKKLDLVVTHDLFMTETTRRVSHLALPSTSWLEEIGYRVSNTHLYLMEKAITPIGEARSISWMLRRLALRCKVDGYFPWADDEEVIDALIGSPALGSNTIKALRARGGMAPLPVLHVAYGNFRFDSPSGKVEFWSERCSTIGLPPLPVYQEPIETPHSSRDLSRKYPLILRTGRTITQFNSFYDESKGVPSLARKNGEPVLWIHPADAEPRDIREGRSVVVFNHRGSFEARARVTRNVLPGVVWTRVGSLGINRLTNAARCLPDSAVEGIEGISFPVGQSAYEALVNIAPKKCLRGLASDQTRPAR